MDNEKWYHWGETSRNSMSAGKFQNSTRARSDRMTRILQQLKRKEGQLTAAPLMLFTLVSIPLLVWCGWAHTHTHSHTHQTALTCANHGQHTTDCAFMIKCLRVCVCMCSHGRMRPHVPRHIQLLFWELKIVWESQEAEKTHTHAHTHTRRAKRTDHKRVCDPATRADRKESKGYPGMENCDHPGGDWPHRRTSEESYVTCTQESALWPPCLGRVECQAGARCQDCWHSAAPELWCRAFSWLARLHHGSNMMCYTGGEGCSSCLNSDLSLQDVQGASRLLLCHINRQHSHVIIRRKRWRRRRTFICVAQFMQEMQFKVLYNKPLHHLTWKEF